MDNREEKNMKIEKYRVRWQFEVVRRGLTERKKRVEKSMKKHK